MANQLDEQKISSFNQDQRCLDSNPLSGVQINHQTILKLQADTLFLKFTQLEDKLKHYPNMKKKWNRFKNILRYSKYPIAILFAGADVRLAFIPIGGIPLAIISTAVTLGEVIGANVLEDSFVTIKINTLDKKCKHITKWLDRMYLFKQDILRDGVIDAKEIEQLKQIINEYEESLKEITTPKYEEKIDLKKIQEQINLLLQQKK